MKSLISILGSVLFLACVLGLLAGCVGILGSEEDASDGSSFSGPTIAYYEFEGTGPTATDSSGNKLNGAIVGCNRVAGKVGQGLQILPGGYVYVDKWSFDMSQCFMDKGEISVEAWIYLTAVESGQTYHIAGGGFDGIRFQIFDGKINFLYHSYSPPYWVPIVAGTSNLVANTWHYVAVTYDGSDARAYLNGVEDGHVSITYTFPYWLNRWYIGHENYEGASSDFPGIIDELRFSNVKLTESEIVDYYNGTK